MVERHAAILESAGVLRAVRETSRGLLIRSRLIPASVPFWSPVTNSFHLSAREMSITLWDLNVLGCLPILGDPARYDRAKEHGSGVHNSADLESPDLSKQVLPQPLGGAFQSCL